MRFMIIGLFFMVGALHAGSFENAYNKYSGKEIKEFHVVGERCSGTNFLHALIETNFLELTDTGKIGGKHFLSWNALHSEERFPQPQLTYPEYEKVLVVVVVRNVYDWVRSFYKNPFHAPNLVCGNLYTFMSHEWDDSNGCPLEGCKSTDSINPYTGQMFRNLLELRRYKNLNYLALANSVDNYVLVNYEEVNQDPEAFVEFLAEMFDLKKKDNFSPVTRYKGREDRALYKGSRYNRFTMREFTFLNTNVDWEVEELLGYSQKNS
ncbi:MAG: hypothetical protein KAR79_05950 [Simkaniaceae bacterium]|nr:hypothetical protein [Simkaniaceae bacterium]